MPVQQSQFTAVLEQVLGTDVIIEVEAVPEWLLRPGRAEMGDAWPFLSQVYADLTGMALPEVAPPREKRRLDILLTYPDGSRRVVEFDEKQHFTGARLTTLQRYDGTFPVGFDIDRWKERCIQLEGREAGGGFARPCPPLFPGAGGRHRQRAFRDVLADVMPLAYGWRPTVRFMDAETKVMLRTVDPVAAVAAAWETRTIVS